MVSHKAAKSCLNPRKGHVQQRPDNSYSDPDRKTVTENSYMLRARIPVSRQQNSEGCSQSEIRADTKDTHRSLEEQRIIHGMKSDMRTLYPLGQRKS